MATRHTSISIKLLFWMTIILSLLVILSGCDAPKTYTGTPKKVLVVMMKWSKIPNCPTPNGCLPSYSVSDLADIKPPRHSAKDYITLLTTEINEYYQNATFGQIYFQFDLLANPNSSDGWWDSPYALSEINTSKLEWKQLAMDIAYTEMGDKLKDYERVLFISNMQHRGGQTCCSHKPVPFYAFPGDWLTINLDDPNSSAPIIPMVVAEVGEDYTDQGLITIISHELGHMLGAPDQYYGGAIGMGKWDVMGIDQYFYHFGAWTKLDRGWIDWNANTTRMPCLAGSCEVTTVLDPVEKPGNNALLIPTDPLAGVAVQVMGFDMFGKDVSPYEKGGNLETGKFVGIMAECRKPINGDENISEEGVLVTFSNPYIDTSISGTISTVLTNETDPYALLQPGETYYNSQFDVRIVNISQPGDGTCTVKATRSVNPAPDLFVTQGGMDQSGPIDRFTSVDIWNDAEINGWEIFVSSEKTFQIITQLGNKINVPFGYGDPIMTSPGQLNSAWGFFHNGGDAVAQNFLVSVYLRQPLGVTVQTEGCGAPADSSWWGAHNFVMPKLVGSNITDFLLPGQTRGLTYNYQTTSTVPLELSVEIEPATGEVVLDNNMAFETYTKFYYETSIKEALSVNLSDQCKVGLPYKAMEIPAADGTKCEKFDIIVEPSSGIILPGETLNFNVTAVPRADARAGETCRGQVGILMPLTSVYSPVETFGFEALVTDPAELTCEMRAGSNGLNVTGQLTPAAVEPVVLTYTSPKGEQTLKNLQTLDNGQYFDELPSALPGVWNVQAWWEGNDTHPPVNSQACSFDMQEAVVKEPPLFRSGSPAYCRQGPSTYYGSIGVTSQGSDYPITGSVPSGEWYFIQFTDTRSCWVWADSGQASGDLSGVEVLVVDIITPTPLVPTITPASVVDSCNQWSFSYCMEKYASTCRWDGPDSSSGICVSR